MYEEQKKYLELEKNLLQERYDARKSASDMAEKEEELAELKRQYAMVSLDSSRVKEAKELAAKIKDAEREINEEKNEELLDSQIEAIDEQISAYDEMVEEEESDLEAFLEDANNFTEELENILNLSQEEMLSWLQANVKDYANSTAEVQEQMIDSWTDTFNTMHNITERWNNEIAELMDGGADKIMEFMLGSDTYNNMTDTEKAAERYRIQNLIDAWTDAYADTGDTFSHTESYSSGSSSSSSSSINATTANTSALTDNTTQVGVNSTNLKDLADKLNAAKEEAAASTESSNTSRTRTMRTVETQTEATEENTNVITNLIDWGKSAVSSISSTISNWWSNVTGEKHADGGLNYSTGWTWMDGTPSAPEATFNNEQYKQLLKFIYTPYRVDTSAYTKASNTITVGDIVINTSSISDDADVEKLAEIIGEKFNEQLNANGFNTSMLTCR